MMRVALLALSVGLVVMGTGCANSGEVHDVAGAANARAHEAEEAAREAASAASHAQGGNSRVDEAIGQAAANADRSAQELSSETGISFEEARDGYCHLMQLYENEGIVGDFNSWAMEVLEIPEPRRLQAEAAIADLGEAINEAENGEAFDALSTAVCAP